VSNTGPIRASEVAEVKPEDLGLTEEEIARRRAAQAARAAVTRRRAVHKAGGHTGDPTGTLAERLEAGSARAREESVKRFKAREAVAKTMRRNGAA
jgi:hypothetical protein